MQARTVARNWFCKPMERHSFVREVRGSVTLSSFPASENQGEDLSEKATNQRDEPNGRRKVIRPLGMRIYRTVLSATELNNSGRQRGVLFKKQNWKLPPNWTLSLTA